MGNKAILRPLTWPSSLYNCYKQRPSGPYNSYKCPGGIRAGVPLKKTQNLGLAAFTIAITLAFGLIMELDSRSNLKSLDSQLKLTNFGKNKFLPTG